MMLMEREMRNEKMQVEQEMKRRAREEEEAKRRAEMRKL